MLFPENVSYNQQLEGAYVRSQLSEEFQQLTTGVFCYVIEDAIHIWFHTAEDRLYRMDKIWLSLLNCRAVLREKRLNVNNVVFATWENRFLLGISDDLTTR